MCRGKLQDFHVKGHDKDPATQPIVKTSLFYLLVSSTVLVICGFVVHDYAKTVKLQKSLTHAEIEIKQLKDALHMNDSTSMYIDSVTENTYQGGLSIDPIKRDLIVESSTRKYRRKSDDKMQLEAQMTLNQLKKITYYPNFTSTCMKFINVSDVHEIIYEMPVSDSVVTCTWVLWSVNQRPMHISFNKSEQTPLEFLPTFSAIIAEDLTDHFGVLQHAKLEKPQDDYRTNRSNWAVIFFRGKATTARQGLHLVVSEVRKTSEERKDSIPVIPTVSRISTNCSQKFPVLVPGNFKGLRRPIFVLGDSVKGMKARVRVLNLQTEPGSDGLSMIWYNTTSQSPEILAKQTRMLGKQMSVDLRQSEPFVLFMTSNSPRSQRVAKFRLNVRYIVDGSNR